MNKNGFAVYLKTFVAGIFVGAFVSVVALAYKLSVKYALLLSENLYGRVKNNYIYILPAVAVVVAFSFFASKIYEKLPEIKGGGIPVSVKAVKGETKIGTVKSLLGVFVSSVCSFFMGAALGNEGPCVQMATAVGNGGGKVFFKEENQRRNLLAAGACAGFSMATGSFFCGILFLVEELLFCFSPVCLVAVISAVASSYGCARVIFPLFKTEIGLLPRIPTQTVPLKYIWIALAVGTLIGIFSFLAHKFYYLINFVFNKKLKKIPLFVKIFFALILTLVFGIISKDFIYTGHDLTLMLVNEKPAVLLLFAILIVRCMLTFSLNSASATGGTFVPLIAIGATASAIIGCALIYLGIIPDSMYLFIIVLGICCAIASTIKMPLVAVAFSLEIMSGTDNVVFVVTAAAVSFVVVSLLKSKSINQLMIEKNL